MPIKRNKIKVNQLTNLDTGRTFNVYPPKSNGFTTKRLAIAMYLGTNPHDPTKNLFLIFTTKKSFGDSHLFHIINNNPILLNFFDVEIKQNYGFVSYSTVTSVWSTSINNQIEIVPLSKRDNLGNEVFDANGNIIDLRLESTEAKIILDAFFSPLIANRTITELIKNINDQKLQSKIHFGNNRTLIALQLQAATRLYENFSNYFDRNLIKYNYSSTGTLISKEINWVEFDKQVLNWMKNENIEDLKIFKLLNGNHSKFELTQTTTTSKTGATLTQIQACKAIPELNIKIGDLGGFVEHESNLSHLGASWVDNTSKVEGARSRVFGNSLVSKSSVIDSTVENSKLTNCCYVKASDIKGQDYDHACIVKNNVITKAHCETHVNDDGQVDS